MINYLLLSLKSCSISLSEKVFSLVIQQEREMNDLVDSKAIFNQTVTKDPNPSNFKWINNGANNKQCIVGNLNIQRKLLTRNMVFLLVSSLETKLIL